MKHVRASDTGFLLSFFVSIIIAGTILLALPVSWKGSGDVVAALPLIDAFFIATSAVCVTGLATVDVASFSRFGQVVILLLIQIGGLGIISITSLLIILPGGRLPFRRMKTIRDFSLESMETRPSRIVRNIVLFTFIFEIAGALALYAAFPQDGSENRAFSAVFHAVSAFCNAGFSLHPSSMESFAGNSRVLGILSFLVVAGGIGFVVIQDIERRIRGVHRHLSYHSRLVMTVSAFLILAGGITFWLLEREAAFADLGSFDKIVNAIFQAVTPRTAGFNSVPQSALRQPSKLLTLMLMFIGGSSGSIAGGIKVSTAYLVFIVMLRRPNERGEIDAAGRRFSPETTNAAIVYLLKAASLLLVSTCLLSIAEGSGGIPLGDLLFEAVSAFGTVGLSLGITPGLSGFGKLVVIATMFAGRIGLIALTLPSMRSRGVRIVHPEAQILVG